MAMAMPYFHYINACVKIYNICMSKSNVYRNNFNEIEKIVERNVYDTGCVKHTHTVAELYIIHTHHALSK